MKLNNKGFAISTILYGLLIVIVLLMAMLMNTMSFSRNNSKKFVNNIIDGIEYRDLDAPEISVIDQKKVFYTKTDSSCSITFKVTDANNLRLSDNYAAYILIGSNTIHSINCSVSKVNSKTATINCKYNLKESNIFTGKMKATIIGTIQDEFYNKIKDVTINTNYTVKERPIVDAWNYSESASDFCVTGEQSTCKHTDCFKDKNSNSCAPKWYKHTIIKYKVNDNDTRYFIVMYDLKDRMILIDRENLFTYDWNGNTSSNNALSTYLLKELDKLTKNWTNVGEFSYQIGGTDPFNNRTLYTICSSNTGMTGRCESNAYSWSSESVRARMISVQEASDFGCVNGIKDTCPKWLYNYSENCRGCNNNLGSQPIESGVWTLNVPSKNSNEAFYISSYGSISKGNKAISMGIRPIVVIKKPYGV